MGFAVSRPYGDTELGKSLLPISTSLTPTIWICRPINASNSGRAGHATPNLMCNLEHHAVALRAAICRRAVKIARAIDDQAAIGILPVLAVEGLQHRLLPLPSRRGRQLEHHAVAKRATVGSRAVEIADGVEDYSSIGPLPVLPMEVKLCNTFSAQPPRALGVNSNTVPQPTLKHAPVPP